MEDSEFHALDTLRNLTLQVMLIAAGVFGIVGGFITASGKAFEVVWLLMVALSAFAGSGFFGYLVHGTIVGILHHKREYSSHYNLIQGLALVQILLFILGSVTFIIFVGCNLSSANAQEIETSNADQYVEVVNDILNKWDAGELVIPTSEFREAFIDSVKRRVEMPVYDFEMSPMYIDAMIAQYDELGAYFESTLPLTEGARMVLLGPVLDRSDVLSNIMPSPKNFFEYFGMETMIVLSKSQQNAIGFGNHYIDSRAVITSYIELRSLLFPFCCWDEPR